MCMIIKSQDSLASLKQWGVPNLHCALKDIVRTDGGQFLGSRERIVGQRTGELEVSHTKQCQTLNRNEYLPTCQQKFNCALVLTCRHLPFFVSLLDHVCFFLKVLEALVYPGRIESVMCSAALWSTSGCLNSCTLNSVGNLNHSQNI